jgi:hypothetical protein
MNVEMLSYLHRQKKAEAEACLHGLRLVTEWGAATGVR